MGETPPSGSFTCTTRVLQICDTRVEAYRRDRASNAATALEAYLPQGDAAQRRAVLVELIKVDLAARWAGGERPSLREYCVRHAELGALQELPVDLIFEAYMIAREHGVELDLEEFPAQAVAARSLIRRGGRGWDAPTPAPRPRREPVGDVTLDLTSGGSVAAERFRVLRPHAKDGLGEVFVALDGELGREVAVKEIQPAFADDYNSRERFVMEAEVTGSLEHPGIVPVYGLGRRADGRPYYAMRLIRGESLKQAVDQHYSSYANSEQASRSESRMFALRQLLGRFVDVCNAVAYAHSRGVLHRDLKPSKIMLGKYGETLVVDWGLAKVVGQREPSGFDEEAPLTPKSGSGSAKTQMGSALGTIIDDTPDVVSYTYHLAKAYANVGRGETDPKAALEAYLAAVGILEAMPQPSWSDLYNVACYRSRCLGLMSQDQPHTKPEREEMAQKALAAVGQAIAAGFDQFDYFRKDPDLQAIRELDAFEELLQKAEKKLGPVK